MPLITCPDCRREISDAAVNCPQCGRPMQAPGTGFVATAAPTNQETDVERGNQRAAFKSSVGSGVGLALFALAVVVGISSGNFVVGIISAIIALGIGIWIQYS